MTLMYAICYNGLVDLALLDHLVQLLLVAVLSLNTDNCLTLRLMIITCLSLSLSLYAHIYNLPPLIITPPDKKTTLWGNFYVYYQFRRRHDYPPHK